ncbi:MAG: hypothetical protein CME71_11135 [Halobacteriovorax sp.]|nr:hypothetical protein [Halobacteriovorax sp.]|tara:strand:- start:1955 stop:2950 length:996 start_codon:yes stop_codon:yes gene_type:complete
MISFSKKYLSLLLAFAFGAIGGGVFPFVFMVLDLKELELDISLDNMLYVFNSQNIYIFSSLAFPAVFGVIATLFIMITRSHKALLVAKEQVLLEQKKSIMNSKMASVGVMASGVAHEINNPITIVNLSLKKAERTLKKNPDNPLSEELLKILSRVNQTTARITKIIDTMKQLTQDVSSDKRSTIQISTIVNETIDFLSERLKTAKIEIKTEVNDFVLECNKGEISRVLNSLIINSIDEIVAKNLEDSKRFIEISVFEKNGKRLIAITDGGPGIAANVVNNIFDPFFTTKDVSEATGLGLNTAKKIMNAYDGDLFYNDKNPTTQFIMEFPAS